MAEDGNGPDGLDVKYEEAGDCAKLEENTDDEVEDELNAS